jgi:hypothetical protein
MRVVVRWDPSKNSYLFNNSTMTLTHRDAGWPLETQSPSQAVNALVVCGTITCCDNPLRFVVCACHTVRPAGYMDSKLNEPAIIRGIHI